MNLRKALLFSLLMLSGSLYSKVLIWDIGGVLFDKSTSGIARKIGYSHFLGYMLFDWCSPNIEPLLFDVLDLIPCDPVPDNVYAHTARGVALPAIMCHWQAGKISGQEIITKSKKHIEDLVEQGYFISRRERYLIEKTIHTMFNPSILAHNMRPIRPGTRLLKQCAHERNEDGTAKNTLIALSNWDAESFDIFYELNKQTLSHFNKLMISGKSGFIKPRKATFEHLIKTYNLKPEDCLVIDDQEVNLEAAENLGFPTFHVHRGNYRQLKRVLVECGALS